MKIVKFPLSVVLTICGLLIGNQIFSQQNNFHRNYIDIGFVGGQQFPGSALAGVYGSAGFFFHGPSGPASLDFRAKEMYISDPDQQGTLITVTYRASLARGLFIGIGGAHGHQIGMTDFIDKPAASIGGTHTHIMHSSGFNVEAGYNFNSLIKESSVGLYPVVLVAYTHLFMTNHSMPNLTLNAGFRLGWKKWN